MMYPIYTYGTEPAAEVAARLAKGDLVGAFGLTEPDHGSDAGSMITRARKPTADIC